MIRIVASTSQTESLFIIVETAFSILLAGMALYGVYYHYKFQVAILKLGTPS